MFTVENQDTERLTDISWAGWLYRSVARLGQGPQSLVIRLRRRTDWFTHGLTPRKAGNLGRAVGAYLRKREQVRAWPLFVVVDITPLCNLHCTVCLHAHANGDPDLARQHFHAGQRMSLADYRRLVDEISEHAFGVLLYYLGDPIVHPQLAEICAATAAAGLNAHVSTNFSVPLSDERLSALINSGLTHLTVCIDGLDQEQYQRTRVGGRLDLVVDNLRRACEIRRRRGGHYPRIEVQYIKYQHNLADVPRARTFFRSIGVDQFHELWGWLHNYVDRDPGKYRVFGPRQPATRPLCHWPHLFTLVKYDGTVLPCCAYRLGEQYVGDKPAPHLGNALTDGLWNIWTSDAYREIRRLACNPQVARGADGYRENFCYGCPRLFETDYSERTCRFADTHTFEALYTLDGRRRPVRRPETRPKAVASPASRAAR